MKLRAGHLRSWYGPVLTGLIWTVTAILSVNFRDQSGGWLLIWVPSAVFIAALADAPREQRWKYALAIGLGNMASCWFLSVQWTNAIAYSVAHMAEGLVCISIRQRVLGRHNLPRSSRQVVGVFLAALAGAVVGTAIVAPFQWDQGILQVAWWYMATVLGMLCGVPVHHYLCRATGRLRDFPEGEAFNRRVVPGLTCAFFFLAGWIMLHTSFLLLPLLFVALFFAVMTGGRVSGAVAVVGLALAATAHNVDANLSTLGLAGRPLVAVLVLQGYMLLMLATSLPLSAILLARDQLELNLRRRNRTLHGNMLILRLTETLAGIGRWQYNCVTGAQTWSEQMLKLNGLPSTLASDPGNVRDLLPDGGEELFSKLALNRQTRIPYTFEYNVELPDGSERILKLNAFNEFEGGKRTAIFAVAMDVTEERQREQLLDRRRVQAIRLADEARMLANTDALTGLASRRYTLATLDTLLRRSRNQGTPLSLVIFDIDHFKRVNDTFGHAVGDAVLVRVSELTQRLVRGKDLVGRLGGEEFVWLLPGVGTNEAMQLAERLREAISRGSGAEGLPHITVSVGLASRRGDEATKDLLERADMALYAAKEAGRDRVLKAA